MEKYRVWFDDEGVWVERSDGERGYERFSDYPRLREASSEQLSHYRLSRVGIHWEEIDEDLGFEGFFCHTGQRGE